jgi:hypothetical protein
MFTKHPMFGSAHTARWPKLVFGSLAVVCGVLLAGLAVGSAQALAATPEAPETGTVSAVTATTATLAGGVLNPKAALGEVGEYQYLYRVSETEECEGESGAAPGPALGDKGEAVPAVTLTELLPNTKYTVCLVERNLGGEQSPASPPVTFTTLAEAPAVSGETFSEVSDYSATLSAQVDPLGTSTRYRFEYGTGGASESSTPETGVGAGQGNTTASAELSELRPETVYHARLIATSAAGETPGVDFTFTTLPVGISGLPDGRVFEMVSPPNNDNADVHVPTALPDNNAGREGTRTTIPFQVAVEGGAITYPADPTVGGLGHGGVGAGDQYLARRLAGVWSQVEIQPAARNATHYSGFSSDLATGVLASGAESAPRLPALSPQAPGGGYAVLYACQLSAGACSEGGAGGNPFVPLFTGPLDRSPEAFEATEEGTPVYGAQLNIKGAVFAGLAGDGDFLFEANDALLRGGGALAEKLEQDVKEEIEHGENNDYLYDWANGQLSLVDILPNGEIARKAAFGAPAFPSEHPSNNPPDFSHVISADGDRVFWTDLGSGVGLNPGVVYMRVNGVETVQVSEHAARYWTTADEGRYAFYTEGEGEQSQLFRFDAEPEAGQQQREVLTGADAGVLGVIGASKDGKEVYAVAEGKLTSGANREGAMPVEGEPNLYLLRAKGAATFVGTLSPQDGDKAEPFFRALSTGGIEYGDWVPGLGNRTAEVAPSGNVVFMSHKKLKVVGYPEGYPNGGQAEVYMFEATTDKLFCVSCSSSGEPLPVSEGAAAYLPISWSDTYLPQWISDEGNRVFFDSSEPLVAQATDARQNVYEWELEGTEGCAVGTGVNGGCIYLLSSGTSEADSWFVGASETGNDAFIVTRSQLTPEDHDEASNLFDAHVCQPGERCVPVTPPACTGTGCQGAPAAAPTFATPPSGTYEGVGNFPPPAPPVTVNSKKKTVKCSRGFAKNKKGKCVRKKSKKRASRDRRGN